MSADFNFRFEEFYFDENYDYQVRNSYFGSWDAAANYMRFMIEEKMSIDCYYECFVTRLEGDCPQLAHYVQKEYLK